MKTQGRRSELPTVIGLVFLVFFFAIGVPLYLVKYFNTPRPNDATLAIPVQQAQPTSAGRQAVIGVCKNGELHVLNSSEGLVVVDARMEVMKCQ
jgi:hypothetical protein